MSKIELTLKEARLIDLGLIAGNASFAMLHAKDGFHETSSAAWHNKCLNVAKEIMSDKLEQFKYDPTKWNEYPDVKPPEGVWMRVEYCVTSISNPNKRRKYGNRLKFVGGQWEKAPGEFLMLDEKHIVNVRFRPWED